MESTDLKSLPKSFRIIGIDLDVRTAIEQIRKFDYEGVEAVMVDDLIYRSPGLNDKMVILLTSEDSTCLRVIAKEFYQADVLTLIVSTCYLESLNCDSLTVLPVNQMDIVVKGLLDPILTHGYVSYDFNDLSTTLRKTGFFKVVEVTSDKIDARMADAVSKLSEPLSFECLRHAESLSIIIYINRNIESPIVMSEMKALTDFISELPEQINVMWALNHDEKMSTDEIRLSAIISGKELKNN